MPTYDYKCQHCGVIEIFHGMLEDTKTICPQCNGEGIEKMISSGGGVIVAGREANQYSDIKHARYWRDKNGVRHPVTSADGYTGSATVNKQTANPAQIKAEKKKDTKTGKKERLAAQKQRADEWNKRQMEK